MYEWPRNGQIYFIRGWHLREFGFPRKEELKKKFKWKKMNFTTDLPKNDPLCSYLVATGKVGKECYRMHVVVNAQEYSKRYRQSEVLKQLRTENQAKAVVSKKSKLLPEDRAGATERMIICHTLLRTNCPHQPQVNEDSSSERGKTEVRPIRSRTQPRKSSRPPTKRRKRRDSSENCYSDSATLTEIESVPLESDNDTPVEKEDSASDGESSLERLLPTLEDVLGKKDEAKIKPVKPVLEEEEKEGAMVGLRCLEEIFKPTQNRLAENPEESAHS